MKKVLGVYGAPRQHWVGNGFPVRSLFSYHSHAEQMSPFLLLDYAGPTDFQPSKKPRGVGQHPHRGFETVTIVYQGEVAHRDSTGKGGVIGPGDVQWMTAGAGILHEEFHSSEFSASGGTLEMVQLWVNLPSKYKMTPPGYQAIEKREIPEVPLPQGAGYVRVIAGELAEKTGPAHTFTPMQVWDLKLLCGRCTEFTLPTGWSTSLIVLEGKINVNGTADVGAAEMAVLARTGESVTLSASVDTKALLLAGEPIDEPIVAQGPFVMNSREQIYQAITDFQMGHFGQM
ncbi:pirin family protein [Microbulbifer pacificus]|uniref:pirin family protein n=1 Tax=Microbulbifer pacificus TaxID=407164 RepID=UPI000CF56E28|nr:pirin family protein [Microbulbifer pacificus]